MRTLTFAPLSISRISYPVLSAPNSHKGVPPKMILPTRVTKLVATMGISDLVFLLLSGNFEISSPAPICHRCKKRNWLPGAIH